MSLAALGLAPSIVPFEPTVLFTAVASVVLVLTVLVMSFFALAPVVSSKWNSQFSAEPQGGPSLEGSDAD